MKSKLNAQMIWIKFPLTKLLQNSLATTKIIIFNVIFVM